MRYDKYSYRFAEEILNSKLELKKEIEDIIRQIDAKTFQGNEDKPHDIIKRAFINKGWSEEEIISEKIKMKHDLFKQRIAIEIETSHIVHTYKDYLKFLLSFNEDKIDVGILIVYSDSYVKKYRLGSDKPKLSKVKKDLNLLRTVVPVPIYVIGLEE